MDRNRLEPLVFPKEVITMDRVHHFHQILDWKSMRLFVFDIQAQYTAACVNVFKCLMVHQVKTFISRIKIFLIITLNSYLFWGICAWSTLFQWFSFYVFYKHNYSVLDNLWHETWLKAKTFYNWQLITQHNDTQTWGHSEQWQSVTQSWES